MLLLSSADFFSKLFFSENSFRNNISVSNCFGPDQDQHFVGPCLGSKCLQRLSTDDKSRPYAVKKIMLLTIYNLIYKHNSNAHANARRRLIG